MLRQQVDIGGALAFILILDIGLNMTYLYMAALVLNVVLYGDVGS